VLLIDFVFIWCYSESKLGYCAATEVRILKVAGIIWCCYRISILDGAVMKVMFLFGDVKVFFLRCCSIIIILCCAVTNPKVSIVLLVNIHTVIWCCYLILLRDKV
jgi:hypothetical protein